MKGWILYKRNKQELTEADHGVNRFLAVAESLDISLEVYRPEEFELVISRDDKKSILLHDKRVALPDFLLPRLGAETSYFALAIIRQLEKLGVHTYNRSTSVEIVKDKMLLSQMLAQSDLPAPKTMLVKFPVSVAVVEREIGFPLVIKNISGARGVGIHLCESAQNFRDLMELIASHSASSNQMILQEFIANSYGRDLRVLVLGGKVIGCMQRTAKDSFKANYSLGGEVSPYVLTPEIESLAIKCADLFNLEIAGIDLLFDAQGFKVCEANSSTGFKGMERATGKNIALQILEYVKDSVIAKRIS
ncbi:Alpha-aminoadipate--LysW ligase LysX [Legionella massiliensis]|uniref:Alpha-aminoadipate--LysW ligase LysX n=1 Tax=Legionella massiliensis TaxID=1034943 RepID=A0A078KU61_9GAMM|nr:RimK family alpha-L-glutamate ligase [Legionella massiliensis]CDZ76517.1 Alpha-aminoadipate--LysW ligase LysX [Legionella massiliensis]CEE12255.1 Ribosomal protein S6 modification protein [Legionella massiliensis]